MLGRSQQALEIAMEPLLPAMPPGLALAGIRSGQKARGLWLAGPSPRAQSRVGRDGLGAERQGRTISRPAGD